MTVRTAALNAERNKDGLLEFKATPVTNKTESKVYSLQSSSLSSVSYCYLSSYTEIRNSFFVYGLVLC